MGRKSRKDIPGRDIIPQPVLLHQKQERIPTGAYIRLSLQNNGLNEMDSITIQTQLVVSYIQAHEELELVETRQHYLLELYTECIQCMQKESTGK